MNYVARQGVIAPLSKNGSSELYRHFDAEGALLYVGVSLNTFVRLGQHRDNSHWFGKIARVQIQKFKTRSEALAAEADAIKKENPLHNKALKRRSREAAQDALEIVTRSEDGAASFSSESRADIIRQLVQFRPAYTFKEAARALDMRPIDIERLCERGELGHFELPPTSPAGKPRVMMTGWQLVEYLEAVTNAARPATQRVVPQCR